MVNPFKGSADAGAKKKSEEDGAAVGEDDGAGDDGAEGEEASKDKTRSYVKRSVYIFKTETRSGHVGLWHAARQPSHKWR